MVCGSGLKSIIAGAQMVKAHDAEVVVAGGMENMSQVPYLLDSVRFGKGMNNAVLVDGMIQDGLIDAIYHYHMGNTAEILAKKFGISRIRQDEYAYQSHVKAIRAMQKGFFADEIVPMKKISKKEIRELNIDQSPRMDISMEGLAGIEPAFTQDGTVTAGNSSGINNGAAAIVVMSEEEALANKIRSFFHIMAYAEVGLDPQYMGLGPIGAIMQVLDKSGLKLEDIDLFEINEAFAATSIAVNEELRLDVDRVNVNGGAIALGHPIGASGARIMVTLMHEMERRNARNGIASLCVGGGMGLAILIRRHE